VGLRAEATGCATGWRADAVAIAKRALKPGELLDGEGGYTVVGRLMPAADSLAQNCLPLGLAHGWKLLRAIPAGSPVKWSDVAVDANSTAVRVRREMETAMGGRAGAAAEKVLAGRAQ
jgi:predicted homoserine dehydrogenase-like protein